MEAPGAGAPATGDRTRTPSFRRIAAPAWIFAAPRARLRRPGGAGVTARPSPPGRGPAAQNLPPGPTSPRARPSPPGRGPAAPQGGWPRCRWRAPDVGADRESEGGDPRPSAASRKGGASWGMGGEPGWLELRASGGHPRACSSRSLPGLEGHCTRPLPAGDPERRGGREMAAARERPGKRKRDICHPPGGRARQGGGKPSEDAVRGSSRGRAAGAREAPGQAAMRDEGGDPGGCPPVGPAVRRSSPPRAAAGTAAGFRAPPGGRAGAGSEAPHRMNRPDEPAGGAPARDRPALPGAT